jgi:hypothetical protein
MTPALGCRTENSHGRSGTGHDLCQGKGSHPVDAGAAQPLPLPRRVLSILGGFDVLPGLGPGRGGTVGFLGGILLVIYPVSDAIATLFDLRSGPIAAGWPQHLNLAADLAAAPAVLIALGSSLADAITVFGVWAIGTGAVMIVLAARRQRVLNGQWLMIISGAGSVFAGTTFVSWTGSSSAGLAVLAQYSAGGAVWYLLTAVWLSWTARPRPGRRLTPARSDFSTENRRTPRSAGR